MSESPGSGPVCVGWMPEGTVAIPGLSGYRISSCGELWSNKGQGGEWRRVNGYVSPVGYLVYHLTDDTYRKILRSAHRLTLLAFVGPPEPGQQGLHADDNKLNNDIGNLRWGTSKENHADAIRNGRKPRGEEHPKTRLKEPDVRRIKARLRRGDSHAANARDEGIGRGTIGDIKHNRTWRHV